MNHYPESLARSEVNLLGELNLLAGVEPRRNNLLQHIGRSESAAGAIYLQGGVLAIDRSDLHVGEVESVGILIGIDIEILSQRVGNTLVFLADACPVFAVPLQALRIFAGLIVGSAERFSGRGVSLGTDAAFELAHAARSQNVAERLCGWSIRLVGNLAGPLQQTRCVVANAE